MPSLQDLPNENLLDIIQLCKPADLKGIRITKDTLCNLRLVSRHFSILVCPILFATLRLEFWDTDRYFRTKDHARCYEILKTLATRSSTVFEHTRELIMHTEKLYRTLESVKPGITQTRGYLMERISDIIPAFKNLQSIKYFYNPVFDPEELAFDLIHALGTLPSFKNLDIHFTEHLGWLAKIPQSINLRPLSNLLVFRTHWGHSKTKSFLLEIASLLTRCPNLIEFALDQMYEGGVTLHHILQGMDKMETEWKLEKLVLRGVTVTPEDIRNHIRHFKNLSYLQILTNDNPKASHTFGQICSILQENAIFLKGVSTDHPEDPLLIPYLSSYSGLTKLYLHTEDGQLESKIESEIIDQVYTRVIPNHSTTLEDLKMGSREFRVRGEVPRKEQLAELARCRNLVVLDVHSKVCVEELREGWGRGWDLYVESLDVRSPFEIMLDRIRRVNV